MPFRHLSGLCFCLFQMCNSWLILCTCGNALAAWLKQTVKCETISLLKYYNFFYSEEIVITLLIGKCLITINACLKSCMQVRRCSSPEAHATVNWVSWVSLLISPVTYFYLDGLVGHTPVNCLWHEFLIPCHLLDLLATKVCLKWRISSESVLM